MLLRRTGGAASARPTRRWGPPIDRPVLVAWGTRPPGDRAYPDSAIDEFDPSTFEGGGYCVERPTVRPRGRPPFKVCDYLLTNTTVFPELGL
jgi:hypothetical protein